VASVFARNHGNDVIALGSIVRSTRGGVPNAAKLTVDDLPDGCPPGRHRDEDHCRRSGYRLSSGYRPRWAKLADEQAEAENANPFMRLLQNAAVAYVKVIGEIVEVEIEQRGQARREASRAALSNAPRHERRVEDDRRARVATPPDVSGHLAHQSSTTSPSANHLLSADALDAALGLDPGGR
jgi:hypothetical protein